MKKYYTLLLIISIIFGVISLSLLWFSPIKNISKTDKSSQILNEIRNQEEINDPEGYAYIIKFIGSFAYDFGNAIGNGIFIILIPGFLLFNCFISQMVARLFQIGKEKNWKRITSNVFTYISMILEILLFFNLITVMIGRFHVNTILIILALLMNIICITLYIITIVKINKLSIESE